MSAITVLSSPAQTVEGLMALIVSDTVNEPEPEAIFHTSSPIALEPNLTMKRLSWSLMTTSRMESDPLPVTCCKTVYNDNFSLFAEVDTITACK